ncbi:MAG: hypothetical protein M3280_12100, partial [Actinomycetota bacterium]|nr:hypothetical protein [Actinomycetota bacterium]
LTRRSRASADGKRSDASDVVEDRDGGDACAKAADWLDIAEAGFGVFEDRDGGDARPQALRT